MSRCRKVDEGSAQDEIAISMDEKFEYEKVELSFCEGFGCRLRRPRSGR